jgi:hypothetical protein
LQGFGTLPAAREQHVNVLYDTSYWNIVMPSYVRFVPQEAGTSTHDQVVVATWIYSGAEGEGEYTGRLYWYACSPDRMEEVQSCETATIQRDNPPGAYVSRPDSLAVSREFVITTVENDKVKEFFCHDHHGQLVARVPSETIPTRPVF